MSLRFFITPKKPRAEKIYGINASGIPSTWDDMPDVVLFGNMQQSYCESLAMAVSCREGVRLRVPQVYKYPGLHGDEIRLTYDEFIGHIVSMVGQFRLLPVGAVISMECLFERIRAATIKRNQSSTTSR